MPGGGGTAAERARGPAQSMFAAVPQRGRPSPSPSPAPRARRPLSPLHTALCTQLSNTTLYQVPYSVARVAYCTLLVVELLDVQLLVRPFSDERQQQLSLLDRRTQKECN